MNQLSIFDAGMMFAKTHARRTDPATSHKAAAKAVKFAASQSDRILAALRLHGPMSPKQMFDFTGLSVVQIDRRRKELKDAGRISLLTGPDGELVERDGSDVWVAVQ